MNLLLVLGDNECGKTAVLRLLCTELTESDDDIRLEIVDYRRTLLGVVEHGDLTGYSVSGPAVTSRIAALAETLNARMPDECVTQRQLRDRSWWTGPDVVVVVDDYDLVVTPTGNPLAELLDLLVEVLRHDHRADAAVGVFRQVDRRVEADRRGHPADRHARGRAGRRRHPPDPPRPARLTGRP